MIVMKFGGTSVQDAQAIDRVAAIVRDRLPENPVVVVSALARMTSPNELETLPSPNGNATVTSWLLAQMNQSIRPSTIASAISRR